MPELCDQFVPRKSCRGRRECRVTASPMARLRKECRRQVPQAKPKHAGIPCAMVFTLIRSLPGAPACWPPPREAKPRRARDNALTRIARMIPASGYQDAATSRPPGIVRPRPRCRKRCDLSRPPHPRLACRDDRALRPYCSEAGCAEIIMIFGNAQEDYFFRKSPPVCGPAGGESPAGTAAAVRSLSPFFTGRGLG
ncbi:hypothetical protein ACVILH_000596 [Bradyrhizobium sp. USDA 4353]